VIRGPSRSRVVDFRTLGFTTVEPRGNSIPFRSVALEMPSVQQERKLALLSAFVRALSRIDPSSGHLLPRHENLEEIAPFHSVCIHDAARWLLQEFPVDRYLREGIAAAVWRRQRQRGEGVVVRTRIFCLVHGSTETQHDRGAQPRNSSIWRNTEAFFHNIIIG